VTAQIQPNPPAVKPLAVRRKQACLLLSISPSKLDFLISTGAIEARKSGGSLLIMMASVEAYLASLPIATLKNYRNNKTERERVQPKRAG
jgi:hypothetical protein